jgi:4-hydroxy-2-oxoheptanedioate aldolase
LGLKVREQLVVIPSMPVRPNKLKRALREGKAVFGSAARLPEPGLVEALGYAGFDYVVIDAEHGSIGWEALERMVLAAYAADTTPIVRVTKNEPELVMRSLDLGAQGILVPHICTESDARRLRDGAIYPPAGRRGVGLGRGALWGAVTGDEYFRTIESEIVLMAMIEDVEAIENIEAIAAAGLDILFVGTHDLAASMGLLGQIAHPRVLAAADRVVAAAQRHGTVAGFPVRSSDEAADAIKRGYRSIGYGSAEGYVFQYGRAFLNAVRG